MDTLIQDFRYAIRVMRKSLAFTLVAAFTIALGIGANTTIFSALNATVFNPFSFPTQDRLVMVWERNDEAGVIRGSVAPANFNDWREQNQSFEQVVAIIQSYFDLSEQGPPERFAGYRVSASFFDVLGAKPLYGRTFSAEEDQPGNNQVVVLKYSLWQRRFGANPDIVNQTITVNGKSYTVIGVMPADFNYPFNGGELWSPVGFEPKDLTNRNSHFMQVLGLMREGTSIEQARADLSAIARGAAERFPETNSGRGVNVLTITEDAARGARMYSSVMLGSVGFVLLIACANVANLLLARSALRRKEIAIRLAVGASRWRLIRQLLTESVLLALAGGALGLLFSVWGVKALANGIPENFSKFIPGWNHFKIDQSAFLFTLVISIATGLLFGLIPAFVSTNAKLSEVLKEGGKGEGKGLRGRTRNILVVSEIALSMILLIGAALMIKSFIELLNTDLGVRPGGVLTMQVSLPNEKYDSPEKRLNTFTEMLTRVSRLPGVTDVGATGTIPMAGTNNSSNLKSVGQKTFEQGKQPYVNYRPVTAGYFQAIGTTVVAGQNFSEKDQTDTERVALV
ncbi:MAG TPA: ABC transporter permease, partial [Pyrinomonadaceae bacterium]|nr:ABC transporter permease [Pyrinomonadaceae bacterium]